MEITGKIIQVLETKEGVSERGKWMRASYLLETGGQYPRKMQFEVSGEDRIARFNVNGIMAANTEVTVFFDIDAHEWQGRWFNTVRAYDIRPAAQQQPNPAVGIPTPAQMQATMQPAGVPTGVQTQPAYATQGVPTGVPTQPAYAPQSVPTQPVPGYQSAPIVPNAAVAASLFPPQIDPATGQPVRPF